MTSPIRTHRNGRILEVTLDRPEGKGAMAVEALIRQSGV
jgi:hypothetical protein